MKSMLKYYKHLTRSVSRVSVGFALAAALVLPLFTARACGQTATIASGFQDPPASGFQINDPALISLCETYNYDVCMLVAAFNSGQRNEWYEDNGSSNGLAGTPIYYYINGVYDATYHANNNSNVVAITVLGPVDATDGFMGAQYQGSCTNDYYQYYGFYAANPFTTNEVYTYGIPYTCS